MEWLANFHDPRRFDHDEYILRRSDETLRDAKEREQIFLRGKIIGKPKATSAYTVEELENMQMVGIYREQPNVDSNV